MLAVALAACATAPRLEPPRVVVDSVRIDRITGTEASFVVTLNLSNPNARDVAVDAIDLSVAVEGVPIGGATLDAPLRLPANGNAMAILRARSGLAAVLRVAAEITQRTQEQRGSGQSTRIRYAVTGTALLDGGWNIPFSRDGEFRIGASAR
jgi:LEA14-like dessication related protein